MRSISNGVPVKTKGKSIDVPRRENFTATLPPAARGDPTQSKKKYNFHAWEEKKLRHGGNPGNSSRPSARGSGKGERAPRID